MENKFTFSEIGKIGSLEGLTKKMICESIQHMKIKTLSLKPVNRVCFEDEFSKFIIRFNTANIFDGIEYEEWKDLGLKFEYINYEKESS